MLATFGILLAKRGRSPFHTSSHLLSILPNILPTSKFHWIIKKKKRKKKKKKASIGEIGLTVGHSPIENLAKSMSLTWLVSGSLGASLPENLSGLSLSWSMNQIKSNVLVPWSLLLQNLTKPKIATSWLLHSKLITPFGVKELQFMFSFRKVQGKKMLKKIIFFIFDFTIKIL